MRTLALSIPKPTVSLAYMHSSRLATRVMATRPSWWGDITGCGVLLGTLGPLFSQGLLLRHTVPSFHTLGMAGALAGGSCLSTATC